MPNPEYAYDASRNNYDTNGSLPEPTFMEKFDAYVVKSPGCGSLAHAAIRRLTNVDSCPPQENEVVVTLDTAASLNSILLTQSAAEYAETEEAA